MPRLLLLVLLCLSGCAEAPDRRQEAMATVRHNLEKACRGRTACLQVVETHFHGCFEEYVAATERDGHADPRVMADCMNRRSGQEWFQWRQK
ncbi:MAG TPA: hypothetical protein VFV75_12215 [Candidatus Polarisedimenticolaceae bacterium]|nr:hypothetical protein [Candidatus Polarisedimenticolaceae bacterium]